MSSLTKPTESLSPTRRAWLRFKRNRLGFFSLVIFCVLVLFYLAFHTISGERGVIALLRESSKLEAMKTELDEIKSKRESLENKTKKLMKNYCSLSDCYS